MSGSGGSAKLPSRKTALLPYCDSAEKFELKQAQLVQDFSSANIDSISQSINYLGQ
jgi:hypothetical protein